MCGIAGYWTATPEHRPDVNGALVRLAHRGPDDRGVECHAGSWGKVGLGHTRLSIIDLSAAGHQPMHSADGRYALVFNGEIYNYRELRDDLAGYPFRSESDTEVLLAAWSCWGSDCLSRLEGMFAFAVLDRTQSTLTCVRDPFGIKPLFVSSPSWGFCFASELAALVQLRGEGAELDLQRSYDYLVHGDYDSQERSFIAGVRQLAPGTMQVVDLARRRVALPTRWWSPLVTENRRISFEDAAAELRNLFLASVRHHLRSDVPLGVAVSGGIDSSAVACAMRQAEPDSPIHTFSFIARGSPLSEEQWVSLVNRRVGAIAHTVEVEPRELARDLDDMILAQGEPFGSTSIYAQYRVFKLARESGITVTLDGQGADELLGGYQGYPGQRVRSLLDGGEVVSAVAFLRQWSTWPGRSLAYGLKASAAQFLSGSWYSSLRAMTASTVRPGWIDTGQLSDQGVRMAFPRQVPTPSPHERHMVAELALSATRRGLPALLRHADRNSMRFSVESRVPFLTVQLAQFLFSLPERFLVSPAGETKHVFRAAMRGIVPDEILDRRDKVGFATPEHDWLLALGDQARDWIEEAKDISFLRPERMLQSFDRVMSGRDAFSWQAWRWINFCRWHTRVFQPMQKVDRTGAPSS